MSDIVYPSLSSYQIMSKTPHVFITNDSNFYSAFPHPQQIPTTVIDLKPLYKNWFNSTVHKGGWCSAYSTEKAIALSGATQQDRPGVRKQTSLVSKGYKTIKKISICSFMEKSTSELLKSSFSRIKDNTLKNKKIVPVWKIVHTHPNEDFLKE